MTSTRTRRGRAVWCGGMLGSVVVHILVFLLWPPAAILLERLRGSDAPPAPERPDPLRVIRLAAPAPSSISEASPPRPIQRQPDIRVREMAASRATLDLTPAEPRLGQPGIALATERGASAPPVGAEEQYVQPIARSILTDWRTRRSLHGLVVTARVHVDAAGDPSGLVELVPPTRYRKLNREIAYRVRALEYQPARRNGEPIAAWAEITLVFCHTGVTAASPAPPRLAEAACTHRSGGANPEASSQPASMGSSSPPRSDRGTDVEK